MFTFCWFNSHIFDALPDTCTFCPQPTLFLLYVNATNINKKNSCTISGVARTWRTSIRTSKNGRCRRTALDISNSQTVVVCAMRLKSFVDASTKVWLNVRRCRMRRVWGLREFKMRFGDKLEWSLMWMTNDGGNWTRIMNTIKLTQTQSWSESYQIDDRRWRWNYKIKQENEKKKYFYC